MTCFMIIVKERCILLTVELSFCIAIGVRLLVQLENTEIHFDDWWRSHLPQLWQRIHLRQLTERRDEVLLLCSSSSSIRNRS